MKERHGEELRAIYCILEESYERRLIHYLLIGRGCRRGNLGALNLHRLRREVGMTVAALDREVYHLVSVLAFA